MKDVLATLSKIIFYIFVLAVVLWTASLTVGMVQKVLPDDPVTPFFALALFDGGALAWLLTFLYHGRGLGQRAVSLLMVILDIVGIVIMTVAKLILSGQTYAEIPAGLGSVVVYGVGGFTALNLVAAYMFHLYDPDNLKRIETQTAQDKIISKALKMHSESLDSISLEVANQLSGRAVQEALIQLGVNPSNMINGTFKDVGAASLPAKVEAQETRPAAAAPTTGAQPPAPVGQAGQAGQAGQPAGMPAELDGLTWPVENHHIKTGDSPAIVEPASPFLSVTPGSNGHQKS